MSLQVVQVFDSWAAQLAPQDFDVFAGPYLSYIFRQVLGLVIATCCKMGRSDDAKRHQTPGLPCLFHIRPTAVYCIVYTLYQHCLVLLAVATHRKP